MSASTNPDANTEDRKETILETACCPRCGDTNLEAGKHHYAAPEITSSKRILVGLRVQHAGEPCNKREWTAYHPDTTLPGHRSICRTCLSETGPVNRKAGEPTEPEPNHDEAGQVICQLCDNRTKPTKRKSGSVLY